MTIDINAYTEYSKKILKDINPAHSEVRLSASIMKNIYESNHTSHPNVSQRTSIHTINTVSGKDFKIPAGITSMPVITHIGNDNKIEISTFEPATQHLSSKSLLTNQIHPINMSGFKSEIPKINKAAFSNGLNLDNFTVNNISNVPLHKSVLQELMKIGGILPLNSKNGLFLPNHALKDSTFNSLEYETAYVQKDRGNGPGANGQTFETMIAEPSRRLFGIDPRNLLTHTAGGSYSTRTCSDCSLPGGIATREIVIGAAPMTNLLYATHLSFAALDAQKAIKDSDRILGPKYGVHVSTTLGCLQPGSGNSYDIQKTASNYLNHMGLMLDILAKNKTRWQSTAHLGLSSEYDEGRADFRIQAGTQRLETRFHGGVFDIGFIANQVVIANKISSDVDHYVEHMGGTQRLHNILPSYSMTIGGRNSGGPSVLGALHDPQNPAHDAMNEWFDNTMDILGIHDPLSKGIAKQINKKCLET